MEDIGDRSIFLYEPGFAACDDDLNLNLWLPFLFQGELMTAKRSLPMPLFLHIQRFRSKLRYWIASLMWEGVIGSSVSRSAMVRLTLRIRS